MKLKKEPLKRWEKMNKIMIYTDGSCIPNPGVGGWAAAINRNEEIEVISGSTAYSTNNRMEIQAVIEVINHLLNESKEIRIHTDSSYVVNAVQKGWINNWLRNGWRTSTGDLVKNKDLWVDLYSALNESTCMIEFVKVKGHFGDKFNELVHDKALEEANKRNSDVEDRSVMI